MFIVLIKGFRFALLLLLLLLILVLNGTRSVPGVRRHTRVSAFDCV